MMYERRSQFRNALYKPIEPDKSSCDESRNHVEAVKYPEYVLSPEVVQKVLESVCVVLVFAQVHGELQ
jgi:hypothetical protein